MKEQLWRIHEKIMCVEYIHYIGIHVGYIVYISMYTDLKYGISCKIVFLYSVFVHSLLLLYL